MLPAQIFIFIISSIFAPKIGVIDLSVFIPAALMISFTVAPNESNYKKTTLLTAVTILSVYMVYVVIIQIFVGIESSEVILRTGRALVMILIITACSKTLIKHGRLILPSIFMSIIIHAVVVIFASYNNEFNNLLGNVFANDRVRSLRSSGLVSGFDTAGFFCLVGLLALVTNVIKFKHIFFKYICSIILLFACYFTSRVTMIFGIILFLFLILNIMFDKSIKSYYKIIACIILSPVIVFATQEVLLVLEVALEFGFANVDDFQAQQVTKRFASSSIDDRGLLGMYLLPTSDIYLFFGAGTDTPLSDVGYVKLIFWHGVLGLGMLLLCHCYLMVKALSSIKLDERVCRNKYFVVSVFCLVFILTFKNNYLLTRGVWPLLVLIYLHSSWLSQKVNECKE